MLESFYDMAVGFAFAIQLACYVIISGGVGDVGGGNELVITWLVSTASLLPLICPCLLLARISGTIILIPTAVILFANPFLQLVLGVFKSTITPVGSDAIGLTDAELQAIFEVCFGTDTTRDQSADLTDTEFIAFQALAITGYGLMVILFLALPMLVVLKRMITVVLGRCGVVYWREPGWIKTPIDVILEKLEVKENGEKGKNEKGKNGNEGKKKEKKKPWDLSKRPFLALCIVVIPFSLSVPLLWGIYKLRRLEQQISKASGNLNADNTWGFGQIVAIAMYTPVLLDFWFTFILVWALVRRRRLQRKGQESLIIGEVDSEGPGSNEKPLM